MAYMSQENKAKIAPLVAAVLKKYGVKGSLSVDNHSTLSLTIRSGKINFIGNYNEVTDPVHVADSYLQVNTYWFQDHFSDEAKACLSEVIDAMNVGNWDKSDIQSDYFNVGWYVRVNVGKWNKPYVLVA